MKDIESIIQEFGYYKLRDLSGKKEYATVLAQNKANGRLEVIKLSQDSRVKKMPDKNVELLKKYQKINFRNLIKVHQFFPDANLISIEYVPSISVDDLFSIK